MVHIGNWHESPAKLPFSLVALIVLADLISNSITLFIVFLMVLVCSFKCQDYCGAFTQALILCHTSLVAYFPPTYFFKIRLYLNDVSRYCTYITCNN